MKKTEGSKLHLNVAEIMEDYGTYTRTGNNGTPNAPLRFPHVGSGSATLPLGIVRSDSSWPYVHFGRAFLKIPHWKTFTGSRPCEDGSSSRPFRICSRRLILHESKTRRNRPDSTDAIYFCHFVFNIPGESRAYGVQPYDEHGANIKHQTNTRI